ncbi:MAG: glycosyltransferase [Thaumarchaeota archaeon]|nr:glycosyltransferase [Nitrososphaerota archaeon]MCL5317801.1 glycosyltransferase [Nitrososphaerota archaeon]
MKILVIPTTDWVGHPVLERQHHLFEYIAQKHEVHVLRFKYYDKKNLTTATTVHETNERMTDSLALFYTINAAKHKQSIQRIVKENKIEAVVLSNVLPALTSINELHKKVPIVFDLSDHFPSSGAGYLFNVRSPLGKLAVRSLEMILKYVLTRSHLTVTCSQPLSDYARRLGAPRVTIIPNGVSDHFLQNYDGAAVRNMYGLGNAVVIGFVGMIEFWLNTLPLLQAIKDLKGSMNLKLFIVGKYFQTKSEFDIKRRIEDLQISENVVWSNGFVPYKDLPSYISAMDICTIPFDHTHPTAYYSAPNKLWEYLALQKPVMCTPLPDVLACAKSYVNIATRREDYTKIIQDYATNPHHYLDRAKSSRETVLKRTWVELAKEYEKTLHSLIDSHPTLRGG